jgi:hypothetical protein
VRPRRDRATARRPAGARFLVLPGVGHTPTWDDPELVARTLLEGSAAAQGHKRKTLAIREESDTQQREEEQ